MYKENYGNIPNKDKIISYLEEGYKKSPGKWVLHSWIIGKTAKKMAEELGLDPDIAFAIGSLHDIGKAEGHRGARHFYYGYKILRADSYLLPARIALSHSFAIKDINSYMGEWNIIEDQKDFVADFLSYKTYDDYDLLIQYLDGIIKTEYLGIEGRLEKSIKKHGANPFIDQKRKRLYELEEYFGAKLSMPIEKYMPNPRWYKFPYKLYRKTGK